MQKKGVSFMFGALIAAVLGLIVLFVLGSVFNVTVSKVVSKMLGIVDSSGSQAEGDACRGAIEGRSCYKDECPRDRSQVPGTWSDCPPKDSDGTWICCRKTETNGPSE